MEVDFPEIISEKAVFKELGDDTEYKTVSYNQLLPIAIEAIKELNEKVNKLEERVNILESLLEDK